MTRDIIKEGNEESTEGPAKDGSQHTADLVVEGVKSPASSLGPSDDTQRRNESAATTSSASSRQTDDSILQRGSANSGLHQDVSPHLLDTDAAVLTRFDLDPRYGPASGISRLERWERALRFGLSPPVSIRETVLRVSQGESELIEQIR